MPTVQERLAKIETQLNYIAKTLDEITKNHLPHIYERLEGLEKCVAVNKSWTRFLGPVVSGILGAGGGGLVVYLVMRVCGA